MSARGAITSSKSRAARLAEFFERRPNFWFDARALFPVAGHCGWRGRISDIRRPPFNLEIVNRQRVVKGPDGRRAYVISEYRLVPPQRPLPLSDTVSQEGERDAETQTIAGS